MLTGQIAVVPLTFSAALGVHFLDGPWVPDGSRRHYLYNWT